MPRLNLAINSPMLWNHPVDRAAALAAEFGFSGIEVWVEHIRFYDTPLPKLAAAVKSHGLRLTLHAPSWDLNLCALNENIRHQSLQEIRKAIRIAAELQAADLTVHPGRATLPQPWHPLHHQIMAQAFLSLAEQADSLGVTLSIELMEPIKGELITEPAALNALLAKLPPTVKTTLDVAHLRRESDFQPYLATLQRINKIHFSDRSPAAYHLPPGSGMFDCRRLLKEALATGIPIVLEGFDSSPEHSLIHAHLEFIRADSRPPASLEEVNSAADNAG